MRPHDFRKLTKYVNERQEEIFDVKEIVACTVFMKNDPKECRIHITDADNSLDFTFFEHDDYHNSKFEIDHIFNKILRK